MVVHPVGGSISTAIGSPESLENDRVETIDEITGETVPEPDSPADNESDDDESFAPDTREAPGEDTQGSLDTVPITTTDRTGEIQALDSMCRVVMVTKTPEGQALFCGNPADTCARRTHQVKQADGSKRADVGIYEGVLNSSKKVVDGILDSYLSLEVRELQTQQTLASMEAALYDSAQKSETEKHYHPKTPTVLTFNLEEQPPASSLSRQSQMKAWRESVDGSTPPEPTQRPPAGNRPGIPAPKVPPATPGPSREPRAQPSTTTGDPTLAAEIGRLTDAMSRKLEMWQTQQAKLSQDLIREVKAAVQPAVAQRPTTRKREEKGVPNEGLPAPTIPRTVNVSHERRPRRFYAVVRGRTTGILAEWKAVLASISDYPHAKYKSFRNRPRAEEWYLQQLQLLGIIPSDRDLSDDELSEEETVDYNSKGVPPGYVPPQPRPPSRTSRPTNVAPMTSPTPSNLDLVDFRMAGPDPSTGDPKKIHDVAINITSEVRDLLCPKGLTQEMQSRMLEVTPDVLTCQGKSAMMKGGSEFEIESMWNRFAGAMTDIADVQAQSST
jgi:hypothetical protein